MCICLLALAHHNQRLALSSFQHQSFFDFLRKCIDIVELNLSLCCVVSVVSSYFKTCPIRNVYTSFVLANKNYNKLVLKKNIKVVSSRSSVQCIVLCHKIQGQ